MEEKSGSNRRIKGREFEEENILAIVNTSGAKHTNDANEDRIAFLGAVRAVSILSENGISPTGKILEEVFRILRIGKTLELMMASRQLLEELDKSFPRVYLSNLDKLQLGIETLPQLVVVKEDWMPFVVSSELAASLREAGKDKDGPIDAYDFQLLIQGLVDLVDETSSQKHDIETLRNLLLFQYLVNVLENDFVPRSIVYEGTTEWNVLKESPLNMLLGSRKINYKNLVKDCLTIMCRLYEISTTSNDDTEHQESTLVKSANDNAVAIALPEMQQNTCIAMQKFFTMIIKLDASKKKADLEGFTTRSDGIRTPAMDLILDELTYNSDILHPFLQVYEERKWKLEIVAQYLWKYISKPTVRTRRSNSPADDMTFTGALKCLSNITSARTTVKKIGAETMQFLIGHGFQACLSLQSDLSAYGISSASEESTSYSLAELCRDVISAFKCLRDAEKKMEFLPFGKETLFTALTIMSTKS